MVWQIYLTFIYWTLAAIYVVFLSLLVLYRKKDMSLIGKKIRERSRCQCPFIWSGCQVKFFTCVMFFLPNVIQSLFLNPAKDLEIRLYLFTSNIQYESFLDDCIFQTFHSIFLLEQIQCCRVHNFIPSSFLD